jgi:Carboxypeptidase regulatory-like domain/TonB dependent receptor
MAYLTKLIVVLLFFIMQLSFLSAQSNENIINITVKDEKGGAVSDATVKLHSDNIKSVEKKTNQAGLVTFNKLRNLKYQILVTAKGFKAFTLEVIDLTIIQKENIEVVLEIEPVVSKVDINGSESVDSDNYGRKILLNKDDIEDLPDDPDELLKRLKQISGVLGGDDLPVSVNGIAGADIPPKARIRQVRINQNIFSAQYEDTSGAGIEIFTSSVVEKIEGYASYSLNNSRLNAANPFLGFREPFSRNNFSGGIYFPVAKKASISIDISHRSDLSSSIVTATVLNSQFLPENLRTAFATPKYRDYIAVEFDSESIKNHQIILKQSFTSERGEGDNVGGFSLASRAGSTKSERYNFTASDIYTPNPNLFSQTTFFGNYDKTSNSSNNNNTGVNVADAFISGGGQKSERNADKRFQITNDTTRKSGNYTFGAGFQFRLQQIGEVSQSNFNGTYFFNGKIAPKLDANNNPIPHITEQITGLESYRRTLIFKQAGFTPTQIRNLGGGADQFTISGGNPTVKASQSEFAVYQQNSFGISENLGISFGVRYENQTNITNNFNLSPRIGIIWNPKSKKKRSPLFTFPRISAGFGVFYTRFNIRNELEFQRVTGNDRYYYLINTPNILDNFPNTISVNNLQQSSVAKSQRFIDDKLQTPQKAIANINFGKPLPQGFFATFNFSFERSSRLATTTNINSPLAGTFGSTSGGIYPYITEQRVLFTQSNGKGKSFKFYSNLDFPVWKFKGDRVRLSLYYSFIKSYDNIVKASGSILNAYDFRNEYAPTENDGVHYFNIGYNFPLYRTVKLGGDWTINSGSRFNIVTGKDTNGDGFYSERPAYAANLNKAGIIKTKYGWLDPNPASSDTLIPRNLGRGSYSSNFNAYIYKWFGFNEDKKDKQGPKQRLFIRLDINNVFNKNNNNVPIGNISSPNFLQSLKVYSETGNAIQNNPRRITLGASFYF